ncbi:MULTISPECIES: PTS sugar transporter subunit IIA [Parachlamydia]|jgi:PTS system nitrogen regulatory IIA component|uniref:Nitrogen regulatory protein n=1 Tax=Parachlamydia acanthamoebae TaxID=83552 RepID=A0A0C1BX45_9BACT|nr:PTS sugar transporter subunit IIA [Parachlamydia acanthamoebae]KIA76101.1 Nitrogen regulatory protein [Parachlamydia acanthamoebae]
MDLKIKDVADLLNVSETTIRRWLVDRKIPAYRINHQYRFSRIEIEDWVLKHKLGKTQEDGYSPFDKQDVRVKTEENGSKDGESAKGGSKQYGLYRAIHKGNVLHNVPGATKEEVIKNATAIIAKDLNLDAGVLTDLLLDRENLQPTALNNGIGIPHTRDFVMNTHHDIVVVVFPQQPIEYGALDGQPVHTLFFLFACEDKRHLHLLAKIAHLSHQASTLELLQSKPDKEAFLEYVKNWESSIQKVQTT